MSHTPGPWAIDIDRAIVAPNGISSVAQIFSWVGEEEADANARLIAAAPDLLAALKECRAHGFYSVEHLVDAAIEKAEGKQ